MIDFMGEKDLCLLALKYKSKLATTNKNIGGLYENYKQTYRP